MEKEETHNLDATEENQDKSNDTENISNEEIKEMIIKMLRYPLKKRLYL